MQNKLQNLKPSDRIPYWCEFFEGFKYINSPIEDNRNSLLRLDGFDCVTLVETVLALSYSETLDQAAKVLQKIRYRDGIISWENRNHFTSIDWTLENWKYLENTEASGKRKLWIDRQAFFDKNGGSLPNNLEKKVYISYPFINFSGFNEKILEKGNYIFNIISKRNWVMVDHVGFMIVGDEIKFCHASSLLGKVVIQNIDQFEVNRKKVFDLTLFRIK